MDHVEDRLSGTEDKVEEMDFLLRKVQLIRKNTIGTFSKLETS